MMFDEPMRISAEDLNAYVKMTADMPRIARNLAGCIDILDRYGIDARGENPDDIVLNGLAAMAGELNALRDFRRWMIGE